MASKSNGILPTIKVESIKTSESSRTLDKSTRKCSKCNALNVSSLWRVGGGSRSPGTPTSSLRPRAQCQHKFCSICLETLFEGALASHVKCPFDALLISKSEMVEDRGLHVTKISVSVTSRSRSRQDEPLDVSSSEQEIFCANRSRGCKKVLRLQELESHLKSCQYALVYCPLQCGQQVVAKYRSEHMAQVCPGRIVQCGFCRREMEARERDTHEGRLCPKRPVPCEFCSQSVRHDRMEAHLADCPLRPRPCRFARVGCSYQGTDEETHAKQWSEHADLVLDRIFSPNSLQDEIVQRVTQLEKLASETRSTNETLQGRVDKLSNDVQALEMENMSLRLKIANLEQHDVLAELPTFRFKSAHSHSQSSNGEKFRSLPRLHPKKDGDWSDV